MNAICFLGIIAIGYLGATFQVMTLLAGTLLLIQGK